MRGGLTAAALAPDPLQAAVDRRLNARLDVPAHGADAAPVALGLSGGGDSLALLHLAADWCARARRPLLALTVDHGLSPASAGWTARAGRMAGEAGAGWRALSWTGPKPLAGLPAAARRARHALLAHAAREAGALVLLLAHTADDHRETEALRAGDAPGIGRLREWAPSPAWPQGRGVFLLRPLLATPREALRAWLRARSLSWLEDPANADLAFARARLRLGCATLPHADAAPPVAGFGEALADGRVHLPLDRLRERGPTARRSLSAALACAAGAPGAPRGPALDALLDQLCGGETTISTLGGARVEADGLTVTVGRDLGRRPPADLPLPPVGGPRPWDGRYEAGADEPGWAVGVARGRAARLSPADRAELRRLPPPLRGACPVFVHEDGRVGLRPAGCALSPLAPPRFAAAIGRVGCEADLRALRTSPSSETTAEAGPSRG